MNLTLNILRSAKKSMENILGWTPFSNTEHSGSHKYGNDEKQFIAVLKNGPLDFTRHGSELDDQSAKYGDLFRGGYWLVYLFGFLAVILAVIQISGIISEEWLHHYGWILTLTELSTIGAILLIHTIGRDTSYQTNKFSKLMSKAGLSAYINQDWRYKWQQYRILAEHARYAELFLKVAGSDTQFTEQDWPKATHSQFKIWFAEVQLKTAPTDVALLTKHLDQLVIGQIAYHQKTIKRLGLIAHRLHGLANFSFMATGAACLAHLVIHHPLLSCLTALLPAMGASCHGILAVGEYTRLIEQSNQTSCALRDYQPEFIAGDTLRNPNKPAQAVMAFFTIVTADCEDWRRTLRHADVPKA